MRNIDSVTLKCKVQCDAFVASFIIQPCVDQWGQTQLVIIQGGDKLFGKLPDKVKHDIWFYGLMATDAAVDDSPLEPLIFRTEDPLRLALYGVRLETVIRGTKSAVESAIDLIDRTIVH